jgi:hypothetical protein
LARAHQQSTYQEILSELLAWLSIDLFEFSAVVAMDADPNTPEH